MAAEVAGEVNPAAAGVIFLAGLRRFPTIEAAVAVHGQAFHAAHAIAGCPAGPTVFVTVQDTGGDFGLSGKDNLRAWTGGLAGLTKTMAREWPRAGVKAIDLEQAGRPPDLLADALAAELLGGGDDLEVGLLGDARRVMPQACPELLSAVRPRGPAWGPSPLSWRPAGAGA